METEKKTPGVKPGTKLQPKYRGPNGETWAGRGHLPKWIKDSGKDKEEFRIEAAVA